MRSSSEVEIGCVSGGETVGTVDVGPVSVPVAFVAEVVTSVSGSSTSPRAGSYASGGGHLGPASNAASLKLDDGGVNDRERDRSDTGDQYTI